MKKIMLLLLILVSFAGYSQRTVKDLPVGKPLVSQKPKDCTWDGKAAYPTRT